MIVQRIVSAIPHLTFEERLTLLEAVVRSLKSEAALLDARRNQEASVEEVRESSRLSEQESLQRRSET